MIKLKSTDDIKILREGGKKLSAVLSMVASKARPGVSTGELDALAEQLVLGVGGEPSFKHYKILSSEPEFPTTICASVNEELVHRPASYDKILQNGDILSIDIGMRYPRGERGLYTDMAITVPVGKIDAEAKRLLRVTERCLELAIKQVKPGRYIHDISRAIQDYAEKNGYGVIRGLVGHGVGYAVHEAPRVPNFVGKSFNREEDVKLEPGLVIAIEPMICQGSYEIKTLDDNWTVVMADGKLSAHFEHTVAVTENGHMVITAG